MTIKEMNETINWLKDEIDAYVFPATCEDSRYFFYAYIAATVARHAADYRDYFLWLMQKYPDVDIFRDKYDAYDNAETHALLAFDCAYHNRYHLNPSDFVKVDIYLDKITHMLVQFPNLIPDLLRKCIDRAENKKRVL